MQWMRLGDDDDDEEEDDDDDDDDDDVDVDVDVDDVMVFECCRVTQRMICKYM